MIDILQIIMILFRSFFKFLNNSVISIYLLSNFMVLFLWCLKKIARRFNFLHALFTIKSKIQSALIVRIGFDVYLFWISWTLLDYFALISFERFIAHGLSKKVVEFIGNLWLLLHIETTKPSSQLRIHGLSKFLRILWYFFYIYELVLRDELFIIGSKTHIFVISWFKKTVFSDIWIGCGEILVDISRWTLSGSISYFMLHMIDNIINMGEDWVLSFRIPWTTLDLFECWI